MEFVELSSLNEGSFIVKKSDIGIVFYDEEVESVVAIINGTPTVISESFQEVRNLLLPERK